ncbi:LysR family transcriptional regulator [Nocardia carnea]|uniref:LysR family transcriptional regulator n=1 Tax=Nocardia carnea TaxID=37328 RepID=UPI0024587526|nr:LysR family transcriptional regulator [Nocardia carnea]
MELQQMRYVVAVAETRNFTRAARQCLVVQSALSHQIARLERELGAKLFERTSRRVELTAAGAAFLPAARQALEAADRARAEVTAAAGELRGRLALGAIPSVGAIDLLGTLQDFRIRHPRVQISLQIGTSGDLVDDIRQGRLDIAFLGLPAGSAPRAVAARELGSGELVVVVSPGHPLAGARDLDASRLGGELFVDFPAGSAGRAQSDRAFTAAGVQREVAFEVVAVDYFVELIRRDLCIGLLPASIAGAYPGLGIATLRDPPRRVEYVVWGQRALGPAAAAYLSALGVVP